MSPFSLARLSALLKPIHKRHPRKRALCIGIRNVHLLPTDGADAYGELLHAHSDVDKVVQMLKDHFNYKDSDITVLKDDASLPRRYQPTGKNIMHRINKLASHALPGDQLFLYYAGHSFQTPCTHGSESDDMDEGIRATDGEILDNHLKASLVDRLPSQCKLNAVFDTCHSATILDLPRRVTRDLLDLKLFCLPATLRAFYCFKSKLRSRISACNKSAHSTSSKSDASSETDLRPQSAMYRYPELTVLVSLCLAMLLANALRLLEALRPKRTAVIHQLFPDILVLSGASDSGAAYETYKGGVLTGHILEAVESGATYRDLFAQLQGAMLSEFDQRQGFVDEWNRPRKPEHHISHELQRPQIANTRPLRFNSIIEF